MTHKSLEEQIGVKCRHFNGLMNDHCDAGVRYHDVRMDGEKRYRFPCFKDDQCSERCQSASYLTEDEVKQRVREIKDAATAFVTALDEGRCPHCGNEIKEKKQVGRCVYSLPCYHRLFQGQLGKSESDTRNDDPFATLWDEDTP